MIGIAIIILAAVGLVEAVVDGGLARIVLTAVRSIVLGGVGGVVARAGVRYDDHPGSA